VVALAVLLLVAVLVVYRMWLKREMNSELKKQINQAVGQYFALADTSREEA
jgi:membrane protein implicated in regulation of membrane protease activity